MTSSKDNNLFFMLACRGFTPPEFQHQSEVEIWDLFRTLLDRRGVAHGFMGPVMVVAVWLVIGHLSSLVQRIEDVAVQHLADQIPSEDDGVCNLSRILAM